METGRESMMREKLVLCESYERKGLDDMVISRSDILTITDVIVILQGPCMRRMKKELLSAALIPGYFGF